jgi:hypothetical protein
MGRVVSYTSYDRRDECLNDGVHAGKELVNFRTQKVKGIIDHETTRKCDLHSCAVIVKCYVSAMRRTTRV